jgi:hypothetical protein
MGLSVSPDIYQEKMSAIFSDMENVIRFIDDIALITNGSFENHLNQLDEILQRLKENNLQVNGDKSSFCAIEAEFLGFVLTRQGVKPQLKKVEAIVKITTPKTVKQVRSFIGMINYYKDHIPRRSDLHHLPHLPRKVPNSSGRMIVNTASTNSNDFSQNNQSSLIPTSLFHLKSTQTHRTNKLDQ